MPPPESGLNLSAEEKELLRAWIEQGANWKQHWSFLPPVEQPIPDATADWNSDHPVDRFIHREISNSGLHPQPRADKETLLRRVTLDLTGLPPTVEELSLIHI